MISGLNPEQRTLRQAFIMSTRKITKEAIFEEAGDLKSKSEMSKKTEI